MSKISQDFLGNVGHLYEQINTYDQDFLNEDSEYYDQEAAELVEDILSTISVSMIYEGYSANAVIGFLADSSVEDIVEKYLSFDENIISESKVSEEYIEEQINILNEAIGSALKLLGRGVMSAAKPAARLFKTATKRAIGPGGRKAVARAVTKVKDIAKGVKAALPGIAKGALATGLGVLAGYGGAKLGSGDQTTKPDPSDDKDGGAVKDLTAYRAGGGAAKSRKTGMTTREIEDLGRKNIAQAPKKAPPAPELPAPAPSSTSSKPSTKSPSKPKQPEKPKPTTETPGKKSKIQQEIEDIKRMQERSRQRQGALMGGPEGPGEIDKKEVEASIEAQKEREKKKAQSSTQKESYDAYDLVLEYLLSNGHVDTVDEAHYVMLEMEAGVIQGIVEQAKFTVTDLDRRLNTPAYRQYKRGNPAYQAGGLGENRLQVKSGASSQAKPV